MVCAGGGYLASVLVVEGFLCISCCLLVTDDMFIHCAAADLQVCADGGPRCATLALLADLYCATDGATLNKFNRKMGNLYFTWGFLVTLGMQVCADAGPWCILSAGLLFCDSGVLRRSI